MSMKKTLIFDAATFLSLSLHLWHDAEKYCNSSTQVHPRQLNKTSESHGIVCRWREHNNDINIASEHHRAKSTVVAQVSCLRLKFAIHPASLRLETICRDLWIHNSPRSLAACFCCVEEFFSNFFLLLLLPSPHSHFTFSWKNIIVDAGKN